MGKAIFLSIGFVVLVISGVTTGFSAESCPSPPAVYVSEGNNVTLCWKLLPVVNTTLVKRYTIMALTRPADVQMNKVASAEDDGSHYKAYRDNHNKLYFGRATVEADLASKMLYLSLVNYTSEMENIYCVLYEMDGGFNDVKTCHSHALFLRNKGDENITKPPSTVSMTTEVETTTAVNTTTMTSTAASTTVKRTATQARVSAETNYKVAIIIMGCLLGAVTFLALFVLVLYCRIRNKSPASGPSHTEMKQQKRLLEEKA